MQYLRRLIAFLSHPAFAATGVVLLSSAIAFTANPNLLYRLLPSPESFDLNEETVAGGNSKHPLFSEEPYSQLEGTSPSPPVQVAWQITSPKEMEVHNSGVLRVRCSLFEKPSRLDSVGIPEPVTVRTNGSLAEPPQSRTLPSGTSTPLDWKWILEADEPGKKMIQVDLPKPGTIEKFYTPDEKKTGHQVDRGVWVNGQKRNSGLRSVIVPVVIKETQSYALGLRYRTFQTVLYAGTWFLGNILTLPWIVRRLYPRARRLLSVLKRGAGSEAQE